VSEMSKRRERVIDALNHRQSDSVPVDFGGTAVTGMHVTCVAALREYYGLEKRPVRVHEPYQMLGMIEEDLREALGIDVIGVFPRNTMFGFATENWKSWKFHDLEVLVPQDFNVSIDEKGDTLIYPEGDMTVAPSGRMPSGGYFFDKMSAWIPKTIRRSSLSSMTGNLLTLSARFRLLQPQGSA
jgi:hypothetical protein